MDMQVIGICYHLLMSFLVTNPCIMGLLLVHKLLPPPSTAVIVGEFNFKGHLKEHSYIFDINSHLLANDIGKDTW
jgi:hypothetical protein